MVKVLGVEDVIRRHSEALAQYGGGAPGIRDRGLIEASVGRISSGWEEGEFYPGLFEKAAALLESIIRNHPFVDGNKRTALLAAGTLLELNGWELTFDKEEAVEFALGVANRQLDLSDLIAWLREHSSER